MRKAMAAVGLLVGLTGCSVANDLPRVDASIANFHRELNAQQFELIYTSAGPALKAATTQADMIQLLSAIHRKLGDFQSGSSTGWNDNVNTNGHYVTINYAAKYARGGADESFVYRIEGQNAVLTTYRINSTALIVN
jgi:hypothetical protein